MIEDPIYQTAFIKEMIRQLRALDQHGLWDGLPNEALFEPLLLTQERKAEIPLIGNPDTKTIARLQAFYNAIAVLIEQECGRMATALITLNDEGFGRALIIVGKLVAVDKTLRDAHRFGFASLSKMKTEADALLAVALERIGTYPEVAGL
ncbi:NifX-associated nitrogen fixation protein [Thermochromatium tepidum]|uniref:NifX-associated nitrogen fixation protein n=1 Tax=Thermochromatium tepidum ATCC 43061 TaxID=316276 RepID=A0A6I6E5U2_THETI|nr:NifX-associated nitrogen fixation protein [Thermochromatium tepidum]QGU33192.1 NifX-associated nitrogen fixation protein [Thermochromatium tepidum ATCC 43061]